MEESKANVLAGLKGMSVFDYLVTLPAKISENLFEDQWACQAIFM
jgi:hypothetical protein